FVGDEVMATIPRTTRPDRIHGRPSALDRLYELLDQRRIRVGPEDYQVQVQGIHTVKAGDIWVQVALGDGPSRVVVLHLSRKASADHAIAALTDWVGIPTANRPRTIEVTDSMRRSTRC